MDGTFVGFCLESIVDEVLLDFGDRYVVGRIFVSLLLDP